MTFRPLRTLTFAACLSLLCFAPAAPAAERAPAEPPPAADPPVEPGDAPGVTVFTPTRLPVRESFAARVRELSSRHVLELAPLRERLAAASPAERAAIQRDIEARKREYETALVQLQLDRAQQQGRSALAARLERRLAVIRDSAPLTRVVPPGGAR